MISQVFGRLATKELDHVEIMIAAVVIAMIVMLVAAGTGIALPFFLIPRIPPRGRHEYLLEGQVLSIALDRKEASIKHYLINGFRPATTMSYNVPDAGELAALNAAS